MAATAFRLPVTCAAEAVIHQVFVHLSAHVVAVGKVEREKALVVEFGGALLGAVYPGLKAARQDAIEALAYE